MFYKPLRLFALLATLFGAAGLVRGQDPAPAANSGDPEAIRQGQPTFLVRASVNHATRSYHEGEHLSVRVVSEVDAYVYVVYKQADGKAFQIFPNALQNDNRVQAGQAVQIPASDDPFRWQIGPPFGKEVVKVFASKEPLKGLSDPSLRAERFNPVSAKQVIGVAKELDAEEAPDWAEADVEIITRPGSRDTDTAEAKRYGVFFGVSEHRFNAEKLEASQKKGYNLSSPRNDAIRLNNVLTKLGKLNASRVYTNEKATRKNLELAVTEWLPSISRPGDTIVIYFSGHGASLPGEDGSADGGAALVTYDYMGLDVFQVLKKRAKENTLAPELVPLVQEAQQLVNRAGSAGAGAAMARRTGVSDDLFGHWMQRLDGRQVLVILDVCHAGAFAKDGKSKDLEDDDPPIPFNFLKNNLTRLKSIGQEESALLAACAASQLSLVRPDGEFSIMTYHLIDSLVHSSRTLTLQQAHHDCQLGMKQYFNERTRARQKLGLPPDRVHEPYLFNYCSRPALLKP